MQCGQETKRVLYLVFGKEAQLYAERTMPADAVDTRTFHSLALEIVKGVRASRGQPPPIVLNFWAARAFRDLVGGDASTTHEQRLKLERAGVDSFLVELFKSFLKDTQRTVTSEYARAAVCKLAGARQRSAKQKYGREVAALEQALPVALRNIDEMASLAEHAMRVAWRCTLSGERACPTTFDALTKIMHAIADLDLSLRYAAVLVDETQDFGAQYLETTLKWRSRLPLVFVGDPNQHIFEFLGTVSAFDPASGVVASHSYPLSRSFRFSDTIAAAARVLTRAPLEGAGAHTSRVVVARVERQLEASLAFGIGQVCYLHRTNVAMLMHAVEVVRARPSATIAIAGRGADVLAEITANAELLSGPNRWQFQKRLDEAEADGDDAKADLLRWIASDPRQACAIAQSLKSHMNRSRTVAAEATFSTVHSAKGLEWPAVVLSNDLLPPTSLEAKVAREAKQGDRKRKRGKRHDEDGGEDGDEDGKGAASKDGGRYAPHNLDLSPEACSMALAGEQALHVSDRSSFPAIGESVALRCLYVALTRGQRMTVVTPELARVLQKTHAYWTAHEAGDNVGDIDSADEAFDEAFSESSSTPSFVTASVALASARLTRK